VFPLNSKSHEKLRKNCENSEDFKGEAMRGPQAQTNDIFCPEMGHFDSSCLSQCLSGNANFQMTNFDD
jgi:hypothetical protein